MSDRFRIGGLASGMDTESIIKQLMEAKRSRLNRYTADKMIREYRIEQYQNLNKEMAKFIIDQRKALGFTNITYNGKLRPGTIDRTQWAYKAAVTNEKAFTATASAGAAVSNLDVEVVKLAKGASIAGGVVSGVSLLDFVGEDKTLLMEINGEKKEIKLKATDNISTALNKIKKETGINLSFAKVGNDASGKDTYMLFMSSKETGANQSIKVADAGTRAFFGVLGLADEALKKGLKGQDSVVRINGSSSGTVVLTPAELKSSLKTAVENLDDQIGGGDRNITLKINGHDQTISLKATDTYKDVIAKFGAVGLDVAATKDADGKYEFSVKTKAEGASSSISIGSTDVTETFKFMKQIGIKSEDLLNGVKGSGGSSVVNDPPEAAELKSTASGISDLNQVNALDFGANTKKTITLNINGKDTDIDIEKTDSYQQIIDKFKNAGLNVTATKDAATGFYSFSIKTDETGANASIKTGDKNLVNTFKLMKQFGIKETDLSNGVYGKDGVVVNNGEITNHSNNIQVAGINLTLKAEGESGRVSIEPDTEGVYEKIKSFVESYNKIIDTLQSKLVEERFKKYQPLTDEQRKGLDDETKKLWDEKAKSGLLNNDQTLKNMISRMRESLYMKVEGAYGMYELGVTTGNYKDGAKLVIDETKLKAAIEKDAKGVLDTFFKTSDDINNYEPKAQDGEAEIAAKKVKAAAQRAETGVFTRLMEDMGDGMHNIVKLSGMSKDDSPLREVRSSMFSGIIKGQSVIEEQIKRLNKSIDRENKYLDSYEDFLWKKFTQMEKMIQQAQSQGSWLMGQLGMQ